MNRAALVLALLAAVAPARAERLPWYRGFYSRVGVRDAIGVQEPFHAWAALAFGLGFRLHVRCGGVDVSVLNVQFDPEEGMHTAARVIGYQSLAPWLGWDVWFGGGLSYGWTKGTVDQAISKRRGMGWQGELVAGVELPRARWVRSFVQGTLTAPLYELRDTYKSLDSGIYAFAVELALGVRF